MAKTIRGKYNLLVEVIGILSDNVGYSSSDWNLIRSKMKPLAVQLLDLLLTFPLPTDNEIGQELFGMDASLPEYRKLKNYVYRHLIIQLGRYEENNNSSEYRRSYFRVKSEFAAFQALKAMPKRNIAAPLAKQLLRMTTKYHLTSPTIELAIYLFEHHGTFDIDQRLSERYLEIADRNVRKYQGEILAQKSYSLMTSKAYTTSAYNTELYEMSRKCIDELNKVPDGDRSLKFFHRYYLIGVIGADAVSDHDSIVTLCSQAVNRFSMDDFYQTSYIATFNRFLSNAYISLGKLSLAEGIICKSLNSMNSNSNSWFSSMYVLVQLFIKQRKYKEAYEAHRELINHKGIIDENQKNQDLWNLYTAYLDFLALIGAIPDVKKPSRFRINRFIQEVPEFDMDKRGMKIPLIIAQLLYDIYDLNYNSIERRIDALNQYCSKNLSRKSANFRSNCFIKMLITIPLSNFHPVAAQRKAGKYLFRLNHIPYSISKQSNEVEIIPYEDLWPVILKYLKAPKRKRKSEFARSVWS